MGSTGGPHRAQCVKAPILVFRDEVRTQLNQKAVIHRANGMKRKPLICVAQDTCQGKAIKDHILRKKLLALSDSKTEHSPRYLPLVPGMPVILTQNIAVELGLINDTNGIFRQLVYQAEFLSTRNLSEHFPADVQYVHQPTCALIEITKAKVECNLTDLESNIVLIALIEETFRINVNEIISKNGNSKSD